jgi:hypothetical protein
LGDESSRSTSARTVAAGSTTASGRERCLVKAGACGKVGPECGVGEESCTAGGVMDDGHLEQRSTGQHRPDEIADERDVVNERLSDAGAGVADHGGISEFDP